MTLPVTVPFHDGCETALSLASRLAVANGFTSLEVLLTTTGITLTDLTKGEASAIAKLAKWSGAAPEALAKYSKISVGDRNHWRLGQANFSRESRAGNRYRYCPRCIVEDLEHGTGRSASRPFVRMGWMTKAITNCVEHERPLIEIDFPDQIENDFCRFVVRNLDCIRTQAAENVTQRYLEVDRFVVNRIYGVMTEPYLDRFEAYVAIELCTYLGRFLRRQEECLPQLPIEIGSVSDPEVGHYFARRGAETIRDLIMKIIEAQRPKGHEKFLFNPLGRWLRSNSTKSGYAELLELFQDVAERNLPFGPGEMCFVPVRKRYLHCVNSARIQYGLHDERVVQLVRDAGLIDDNLLTYGKIYFDAEKAHEILQNASLTLTSKEVGLNLGATERMMNGLLNANLLPRVELKTDTRAYSRFTRQALHEFKLKIFEAGRLPHDTQNMATINGVCRKCGCTADEVIALILNGTLKKIATLPNIDFKVSDVRLDMAEAVGHLVAARLIAWEERHSHLLTTTGATAALRVKASTTPYLIELGLIRTETARHPTKLNLQTYVTKDSIEAFKTKHISLGDLSVAHQAHAIVVTQALDKMGVRPIYERTGSVTSFYDRSEVVGLKILTHRWTK